MNANYIDLGKRSKRVKYATVGSGIWIALVLVYVFLNWGAFRDLLPNALGDFFAGAAAPLAFLWLVVGYFQQGDELRFQAEQLRLQVKESKNLVREAARQAKATTELLKVERERHEEQMRRVLIEAQPSFQRADETISGDLRVLKLRNIGAAATDLCVRSLRGSLVDVRANLKAVATGETVQIDCSRDGRFPWEFELELEYLDAALRPRKSRVICTGASAVDVRRDPLVFEELL